MDSTATNTMTTPAMISSTRSHARPAGACLRATAAASIGQRTYFAAQSRVHRAQFAAIGFIDEAPETRISAKDRGLGRRPRLASHGEVAGSSPAAPILKLRRCLSNRARRTAAQSSHGTGTNGGSVGVATCMTAQSAVAVVFASREESWSIPVSSDALAVLTQRCFRRVRRSSPLAATADPAHAGGAGVW